MYTGYTQPQREDLWASFRPFIFFGGLLAVVTSVCSISLSYIALYEYWFNAFGNELLRNILSYSLSFIFDAVTHLTLFYIAFSWYEKKRIRENDEMDTEEKKFRYTTYNGNMFICSIILVIFLVTNAVCNYQGAIFQINKNNPAPIEKEADMSDYNSKLAEAKAMQRKIESNASNELGSGHLNAINQLETKINIAHSKNKGYELNHPNFRKYKQANIHYWVKGSYNANASNITKWNDEINRLQKNYDEALDIKIKAQEHLVSDLEIEAEKIKTRLENDNRTAFKQAESEHQNNITFLGFIVVCFVILFAVSDTFFHFFFQRANFLSGRAREIVSNPHDHSQGFFIRFATYIMFQLSNIGDAILDKFGVSEMEASLQKGALGIKNTDEEEDITNDPDYFPPNEPINPNLGKKEAKVFYVNKATNRTANASSGRNRTGNSAQQNSRTAKTAQEIPQSEVSAQETTAQEKLPVQNGGFSVAQVVMDGNRTGKPTQQSFRTVNSAQEKLHGKTSAQKTKRTENNHTGKTAQKIISEIRIGNSAQDIVDFHVRQSQYCTEQEIREEAMEWLTKTPDFFFGTSNMRNWYNRKNSPPKKSKKDNQPTIKSLSSIEMSALKYDLGKFICESSGIYRVEGSKVSKIAI